MPRPGTDASAPPNVPAAIRDPHPNGRDPHRNGRDSNGRDPHPNGRDKISIRLPADGTALRRGGARHAGWRRDICVTIVGGGYVGLALAAHLVVNGRSVILVETDPDRRQALAEGDLPIYEPGLGPALTRATADGVLDVTGDLRRALAVSRMVFIAVGTPPAQHHHPDLSAVSSVVSGIRAHARPGTVVALKSTVPPGTARGVQEQLQGPPFRLPVVSCPEFLREGSALEDMRSASRQVIGGDDTEAMRRVEAVIRAGGATVIRTDWTSSELIKYGSNSFLALKISFANELAHFAELAGADIVPVVRTMGLDPRICGEGMQPGVGFGGSCLPKDVRALVEAGEQLGAGFGTLKAALQVNATQRTLFAEKIRQALGGLTSNPRVAILGLAFKPGTDDIRSAPSLEIIGCLLGQGCSLAACDPCAIGKAAPLLPPQVRLESDPYDCLRGADAAAIVTEWPEYVRLDWDRARQVMRRPVLVDGRNCLDPAGMASLGFHYHAVGRPRPGTCVPAAERKVTAPAEGMSA